MDSILGDFFKNGRRLRPATLEYATKNYPKVVLYLKLNKFQISAPHSCDGADIIDLSVAFSPSDHFIMTRGDFNKCLDLAKKISVPLFCSEIQQDYLDKCEALIKEFW